MVVAFRVDASTEMGIGHARRCLSLARALADTGVDVVFVARALDIDLSFLGGEGFELCLLEAPRAPFQPRPGAPAHAHWARVAENTDAEQTIAALRGRPLRWVVVDHYAFGAGWHRAVGAAMAARVCALDDLADRPVDVDLLVDHNLAADHRQKYAATGSRIGRLLGGPRYALLDRAYRDARRYAFSEQVRSVGVFVGGTDPGNASALALDALRRVAAFEGAIEIATTRANPFLPALQQACADDGAATLLTDQPSLETFFARHDVQIGAGGGAALERCCIGAPTLLLALADNQRVVARELDAAGAAQLVPTVDAVALGQAFAALQADVAARRRMADCGRRLVDGHGTRRIAVAMSADRLDLRAATAADAQPCHAWRNAESTRRFSRDPSPVALPDHLRWWQAALDAPARHLLVAQVGTQAVGVVRLDAQDGEAEVSIYIDPVLTGVGLGPRMLEAAARWAAGPGGGLQRLVAEIDPRNTASAAAFARSGFHQVTPRRWTRSLAQPPSSIEPSP